MRKKVEHIIENGVVIAKKCTVCLEMKSIDEFDVNKQGLGGRRSWCKKCAKEYRTKNKEKLSAYYKEYRKRNLERERQRIREWFKRNKEYLAEYREKNREAIRARIKRYQKSNPEKLAESQRKYREKNRMLYILANQRRYARRKYLVCNFTERDAEILLDKFGGSCAICNDPFEHFDHFIALSTGHGGTYIGNLLPLCSFHNHSKNDRNPFEWVKTQNVDLDKWNFAIKTLSEQNGVSVDEFREFVYWCYENQRTVDQIKKDRRNSLDIWLDHKRSNKTTSA